MEKGKYRIRTLARFQADLLQITDYITNVLGNASAADRLVDHVVIDNVMEVRRLVYKGRNIADQI